MKWETKTLAELGFVGRGKSKHRPRNAPFLYGGKYPFIQTGDINKANLYITDFDQTYSEAGLQQSKLWNEGTLVISIVGANTAETAILRIKACFPDSVIGFVADEKLANTKYVKYYLDTIKLRMKRIAEGAARENLSMQKLLSFKIPAPPIQIQNRIAAILSAYDDLIENNLRRIRLLEEAAQLIYKEWFVYLRFPGWEGTEVQDGLPVGWEKKPLKEVCSLTMGQSPKSEFYNDEGIGLPFHQGVSDFGDRYVSHSKYCTVENRIAEPGDILCSVRAPVGRLNLTSEKIVIGRGLSAIRNRSGFQRFQYYQLKNHFHTEDMIGGGAIFNSVTKKELEHQPMVIPPRNLIKGFEENTIPIDKQILNLIKQNQKLQEARDILLLRLMNGTIEVEGIKKPQGD